MKLPEKSRERGRGMCRVIVFRTAMARWVLFIALFSAVGLAAPMALDLPDGAASERIHPGAWKFSWEGETTAGPVVIHGVYWKRDAEDLALMATAGTGKIRENEAVRLQAERLKQSGRKALAAVNSDFFVMRGPSAGSVFGLFVRDGELLSLGEPPALAVLEDGLPMIIETFEVDVWLEDPDRERISVDRINHERGEHELVLFTPAWGERPTGLPDSAEVVIAGDTPLRLGAEVSAEVAENDGYAAGDYVLSATGDARDRVSHLAPGTELTIQSEIVPDLPLVHASGAKPVMIRGGEVVDFEGAQPEDYIPGPGDPNARHPRTAFGFSGDYLVALVVDGRAPGYSLGMTIPELGTFMRELGCTEAINLDGGGSSTVWTKGEILNRPSGGRERPVGNALVLVSRAEKDECCEESAR